MRPAPGLRRAFRFPFGRHQVRRDVEDELRFHLEMRTRELVAEGMEPAAARREAERRFGDLEAVRRRCLTLGERRDRGRRRRSLLAELGQDLRYAVRALRKGPGFAAVAVLTLALGIGATTAIWSVVDAVLLRPLPLPESERLVAVWADTTRRGGPLREWLSYPNYHDLAAESGVFSALGLYDPWLPTLTGRGEAEQLAAVRVTGGMLARVLRVEPALGRSFSPEEDQPDAPRAVVVSHRLWSRVLGADPGALGTTLTLNGEPWVVVGVMPAGFRPPFFEQAELWAPLRESMARHSCERGCAIYRGVGRLAPGVSLAAARAAADGLAQRLEAAFPEANTGVGYALFPLREDLASSARTALWVLLAAVVAVLLVACVNVANLLLARATARGGELAVRAALGAGRSRISRQLLAESGLLALGGGGLGLALAFAGTDLLVALAPAGTPRLAEVAVDGRVLAFAAAVTFASVFLFGLLPSLRASRADLQATLREGGRGGEGGSRSAGLRGALVVAQVALAMVLLVGAGLLLRSFRALTAVDPGFDAGGVLSFNLNLPPSRYPERADLAELMDRLEAALAALPGVRAVGAVSALPMSGNDGDVDFLIAGEPPPPPGQEHAVWFRRATPGYFEAMGIRLVAGRPLAAADHAGAPLVIVVNQALARRHFAGRDPLGQRISVNDPPLWREIVGVAGDVKNFGLARDSRDALYLPYAQIPGRAMSLVLKAAGEPSALAPAVRRTVASLDPQLAVAGLATMESAVRGSLAAERFATTLLTLFAGLALLLALVGLYGLVAYTVGRRTREMGVRIALGAGGGDIGRLVVGESLALVAAGVALGLAAAYLLTRLMTGLLFGVTAADPLTYGAVTLVLAAAAVAACLGPARRAARVDPVAVLKSE